MVWPGIPWNPPGIHLEHSMESIWNHSAFQLEYGINMELFHGIHWNPYGMVGMILWNPSGIQLEWSMIPGGIHRACGIKKWLWPQPKVIPWNPYGMTGGFHGFHMDSTWITWGSVKTSFAKVRPMSKSTPWART